MSKVDPAVEYSKLERYYELLYEQKLLGGISGLLSWDQETKMPVKNTEFRSEQRAYISKLAHFKATDPEFVDLVNGLYEHKDEFDQVDARSIELSKRDLDRSTKLPSEFVEEFSKVTSLAHEAWISAKTKEDFQIFKPHLEKIIELTKKQVSYIDDSKPIYDVLLDDYEEGMTSEKVDEIFGPLKESLKKLLAKVETKESRGTFESLPFEEHKVLEFVRMMTEKVGFDYERGAMGVVHHPFETSLSPNDIRINTTTYAKNMSMAITGMIHELGHGLYEQNIDEDYHHTDFGQGRSLGIHESQSRLVENMIGRSEAFWTYFAPELAKTLGVEEISVEDIVHDLNIVRPSFIRTEADEVTYNMHIILRYEIEKQLLSGELSVDDLPEAWNAMMKELLGIVPDKPSNSCLQDVHWSMGGFGYFPTYTLGNLNAGQLWGVFIHEYGDWESKISAGDFSQYFTFFKEHIWQHGAFYTPEQFIENATGEELDSQYLVEYLKSKFGVSDSSI